MKTPLCSVLIAQHGTACARHVMGNSEEHCHIGIKGVRNLTLPRFSVHPHEKGLYVVKPQVVGDALLTYRRAFLYMFALSHIGGDGQCFRPS